MSDIFNDRRNGEGPQPRRSEPRGGEPYKSPSQKKLEAPFKATHTYQPIGWDQFDARPHPGSRPIMAGSPVQKIEQMSPAAGRHTLHHVRDEQGNHQSVAQASLGRVGPGLNPFRAARSKATVRAQDIAQDRTHRLQNRQVADDEEEYRKRGG